MTKRDSGFASMNQDKRREISSQGGKAAHQQGRAHTFTAEEARAAGRKGGLATSTDRERMAEIGRLGGLKRAENRKKRGETA